MTAIDSSEDEFDIQHNKAIEELTERISRNPNDESAYLVRGIFRSQKKEYDAAISDFTNVIELDAERRGSAYSHRAKAWAALSEYDRVIDDLNEAILLDADGHLNYLNRGSAWAKKGDHDKAIKDFTEAIRLDPTHVWSYMRRGGAWVGVGEHDKAIEDFSEVVRLDACRISKAFALMDRGYNWAEKGEFDKALKDHTDAIRIRPRDAMPYVARGDSLNNKGEFGKAIADYNEAIRLELEDSQAYQRLAWLLATCPEDRIRDGKRAVEFGLRACRLSDWKDGDCITTLAAAYAEMGDFEQAQKFEKQAIEMLDAGVDKTRCEGRLGLYQQATPYRRGKLK